MTPEIFEIGRKLSPLLGERVRVRADLPRTKCLNSVAAFGCGSAAPSLCVANATVPWFNPSKPEANKSPSGHQQCRRQMPN